MKINDFFTKTLGAQLKNTRWSWGAVDPLNHRVFLRIWKHDFLTENGIESCRIARNVRRRKSNGFAERHQHVTLIRDGAEGYGVVCTAVNTHTSGVRKIKTFNDQCLVRFGTILQVGSDTRAEIATRVAVSDLARSKTAESTLADDLREIARRKLEPTTREAFINARVGQGLFRQQVLKEWDYACAATGLSVPDAIRASHIKPWRDSDDVERLDPRNGLPLVAHLDALFDAGLISFDQSGTLLVSSQLSKMDRSILRLNGKSLRKAPSKKAMVYMKYHSENIFRK